MTLFPVWTMPETTANVISTVPPPAYPPDVAWDFAKGEFVLDGARRFVILDGPAAWAQWCVKAVLIQRLAHPIYDANYGTDLDLIEQASTHAEAEQAAQGAIRRALLADPRTASVDGFTFSWLGDGLSIGMTVIPRVGAAQPITVKVSYGG